MNELAEAQDAEALAYELEAEEVVTGGYAATVAASVASILAGSAAVVAGQLTVDLLQDLVHQLVSRITPSMGDALGEQIVKGVVLGRNQGWELLRRRPRPLPQELDQELWNAIENIDPAAQAILDEADRLADALDLAEEDNVIQVTAKLTSSTKNTQGQTRWATNRAVNQGISDTAKASGVRLLWASERNACLKCLAYSGLAVTPPGVFPAGLTLGTGKSTLGAIPYPPLHRYCRCRVRPYAGPDATEKGTDEASGLQREAMRTVARGWSDYASQPERLRAVDLLLQRGFQLPKTVLARAARDLKRGRFNQRHKPLTTLKG